MKPAEKIDRPEWVTRRSLLERVRDRADARSWEDFTTAYRGYLYSVVRGLSLSHHDAEDVVQQVMVRLWEKLPEFEYDSTRGRFRGWLCRVATNEARMFLRRRASREGRGGEADAGETARAPEPAESPEIEAMAEQEWRRYVMGLAWEQVRKVSGAGECEAFERLSRGATPDAAAREMGLSVNSVYVYKKRIQDRLQAEVQRINARLD